MVLLDTNVFVIDRFFRRDDRYDVNKAFLDLMTKTEAGFSIFSLFELCGISSFNLSAAELKQWAYQFDEVYPVTILGPRELRAHNATTWFLNFSHAMFDMFGRRMTWGDAVLLRSAEEHNVNAIITWNKKHFESRTAIVVQTPLEFMGTGLE